MLLIKQNIEFITDFPYTPPLLISRAAVMWHEHIIANHSHIWNITEKNEKTKNQLIQSMHSFWLFHSSAAVGEVPAFSLFLIFNKIRDPFSLTRSPNYQALLLQKWYFKHYMFFFSFSVYHQFEGFSFLFPSLYSPVCVFEYSWVFSNLLDGKYCLACYTVNAVWVGRR